MYCHSCELSPTLGNGIKDSSIFMIKVFTNKIIPKQENKYIVLDYSDDIYDDIFDYTIYGKSLFKPNLYWEYRNRDNAILFDDNLYSEEFIKYLWWGSTVVQPIKVKIISIVKDFLGCFYKEGLQHAIIRYEFAKDTVKNKLCML